MEGCSTRWLERRSAASVGGMRPACVGAEPTRRSPRRVAAPPPRLIERHRRDRESEAVGESEEPEVFYVGREALEALRAKLAAGGAASEGDITALFAIDDLAEAAPLAPLGADVLGEDFDDPEEALKRLGAKATAERLLAASTSEDAKRAKAMTAGEFREMLDADDLSSGEGEEEALESEDSEVSVEHPEKRRKQ